MKRFLLFIVFSSLLSGCSLVNNNQQQISPELEKQVIESTGIMSFTKDQGYITQVYEVGSKRYLKIDYIAYGTCLADMSNCPGGGAPIINDNTLIRTFELANTAIFNVLKYDASGSPILQAIQRNEFKTRGNGLGNPDPYNPVYYGVGGISGSIVEIEHDTEKIYKVMTVYRP